MVLTEQIMDTELFLPGWKPPEGLYLPIGIGAVPLICEHMSLCDPDYPGAGVTMCPNRAMVQRTHRASGTVWFVCEAHSNLPMWRDRENREVVRTALPRHQPRSAHLGYDGIARKHSATVKGREVRWHAQCQCGWDRAKGTKREAIESLRRHIETGDLNV